MSFALLEGAELEGFAVMWYCIIFGAVLRFLETKQFSF